MIKIKAIERKAGFGKTSKKLWYPAIHLHSDVKFEEFIELVADETTVSSADVKAVFDRAAKVLIRLLQDGKSVDCGDMGTFRPSITAKTGSGVDKAEKVGVELVDRAKVIYTPRIKVKTALKGVRMERAERALDVPYDSSGKKKKKGSKENEGSSPTPGDNGGHVGI
ncbi:HU family DNA-binding protein [uncultured Porphyromonas sp.]|uniref:HU family DNA-binding protein n=1 Tax=uncultured Porphyromonas sp. TaxID=159274 RepID=UPI00261C46AF|nr:HU family DNA-binding protein [uncultured Porphyromonas sp.]